MANGQRILFLPGETGEKALLVRLGAGEDAAYRECYQSFAPQVLRVLMGDADDDVGQHRNGRGRDGTNRHPRPTAPPT